ncbi:MAG: alpha/beta hydrolase, partial [Paludibacterium sp.]|uniref:alpha/beta fold hydrolase n=2 Tax=Paludibacterium sp. TaxID=1917523 RepID=UPI0025FF3432
TEVNLGGPCAVPASHCWLTTAEAKKRGWGALHQDSYLSILLQLETSLNDQYSKPGRPQEQGNHLLPELGLLGHLGGSAAPPPPGAPDYARMAAAAVKAWNTQPRALSQSEIDKLDCYYYPVWAHGYNWLQSNEDSAQSLLDKIDQVIATYTHSDYFECAGQVILVSHSMGGLVARRAAQQAPDKILGIVHGVQPVAGAPVVYRRFRAGTEVKGVFDLEGAATAAIIGWDAADVTPTLACSPGPLELLPTKHYPPGWLQVAQNDQVILRLPEADPYEEIYSKTTDDCWWGMLDPKLIDPVGKIKSPLEAYQTALGKAADFHDSLGLYAHPQTYGYYGIDENKYRTFGHITWQTNQVPNDDVLPLVINQDQRRTLTGRSTVPLYQQDPQGSSVQLKLANERNQAGDGTVPRDSAQVLDHLQPPPQAVFRIAGFDHQNSYANPYAIQATVYGIARLVAEHGPAPSPY